MSKVFMGYIGDELVHRDVDPDELDKFSEENHIDRPIDVEKIRVKMSHRPDLDGSRESVYQALGWVALSTYVHLLANDDIAYTDRKTLSEGIRGVFEHYFIKSVKDLVKLDVKDDDDVEVVFSERKKEEKE